MPIEPPELPELDANADERTTLLGMLDYYRAVLVRKAAGLTDEQLAITIPPAADLTLGGLVLHMAVVEDAWHQLTFLGGEELEPWASAPWDEDPDWELHVASAWTGEAILEQFETSVARSRVVVASADSLDQEAVRNRRTGAPVNLRWIIVHLIEEYARHCGHADYLRESIDGATGD